MKPKAEPVKILSDEECAELKTQFAEEWIERFDDATPQGSRVRAAAAIGLTGDALSVWGKVQKKKKAVITLPDAWQSTRVAAELGVSPAWLTFGVGPRDPVAAEKAYGMGKKFEEVPGLAHVAEAYATASPEDQKMMQQMAAKFTPAPKIAAVSPTPLPHVEVDHDLKVIAVTPASAGGQHATPAKSATPPLNRAEAEALLKWFGTNLKTMPLERPLTKALRKISMMLGRGIVPAELPPDLVSTAAAPASPEKAAPSVKAPRQRRRHPSSSP